MGHTAACARPQPALTRTVQSARRHTRVMGSLLHTPFPAMFRLASKAATTAFAVRTPVFAPTFRSFATVQVSSDDVLRVGRPQPRQEAVHRAANFCRFALPPFVYPFRLTLPLAVDHPWLLTYHSSVAHGVLRCVRACERERVGAADVHSPVVWRGNDFIFDLHPPRRRRSWTPRRSLSVSFPLCATSRRWTPRR